MDEHRASGSRLRKRYGFSRGDSGSSRVESRRGDEPVHESSLSASEGGSSVVDDDDGDDLPRTNERGSRTKNPFVDSTDDAETSEVGSQRGDELVQGDTKRNGPSVRTAKRSGLPQHQLFAPDDSDDSSYEPFAASEGAETRVQRSRRVEKRARPSEDVPPAPDPVERKATRRRVIPLRLAARREQKEKWTECVAAAHLVQDEVNRYLQENPVSPTSREVIAEWTGRVTKALVAQNSRVIDNVEAVAAAKTSQSRVDTLRNDVLRLKNHVRISLRDHEQVQEQIEKEQKHNASCRAATRFLKQIDRLRK